MYPMGGEITMKLRNMFVAMAGICSVVVVLGTTVVGHADSPTTNGTGVVPRTAPVGLSFSKTASCAVTQQSIAASNVDSTTTSFSYSTIPGMSVKFKTNAKSCVSVTFSAEATTVPNGLMNIRAMLDKKVSSQTDVQFVFDESVAMSHAFTFYFTGVSAGTHTVSIQWQSHSTTLVEVLNETMLVLHH